MDGAIYWGLGGPFQRAEENEPHYEPLASPPGATLAGSGDLQNGGRK